MFIKIKKIKLLEILFIITMGIAFIHSLDGYIIPNYIKYGISIAWIVIWLTRGKINKIDLSVIYLYIKPYLWIGIISIFFWIISSHSFIGVEYIKFLSIHIGYAIIRAILVLAILGIFGKKTFSLVFKALILSQIIIIAYVGQRYGFNNLLHYCISGVYTSVTNGYKWNSPMWHIGWAMEVHDSTFAFGFFVLYFLFYEDDKKKKFWNLLISCFFIYLGLKRIEILAIIGVGMVVVVKKIMKMSVKKLSIICTTIFLIISYIFIAVMKWNPSIFSVLDISRFRLYNYLSGLLQLETIVIGKGFSIINDYLQNYNLSSRLLTSSHSDLVRMAIELGMIGFTTWIVYYLYIIPKRLRTKFASEKVAYLSLLCFMFVFITYFIDNTLELFAVQTVCMVIPIGVYKGENKK